MRFRPSLPTALCALALAHAAPLRAENCTRPFWGAESIEAYESPREAIVADLDGNGLPDIAVSEYHVNSVQVALRQPSGLYTSTTYGTAAGVGFQPDSLAAGDVDGDGDVDLVVVNSFDRTFTVLKNGGTGAFTVAQTLALGMSAFDIALGDLDGDGDRDLVAVGNATAREVAVFSNTGGTFAFSREYLVAGTPGAVVLARLDSDAGLDVAVSASADNSVSVLWNTGTGVLSAPVRLATAAAPYPLVAGDVNGDGRIDLLTAHGSGGVGLLANLGGRSFAPALR
jgi:FG-GAP-like repeat